MRILLSGGGTAGHINPALAIASTVLEREPDSVIGFVGTTREKENPDIRATGCPLYFVKSDGISRSLSPSNFRALFRAAFSPYYPSTTRILAQFRPDIVVGTGGYACWPILVAAARAGIPTAVHESNALPGMTVRKLARHVDRVLINFPDAVKRFGDQKKISVVGNPLRESFGTLDREDAKRTLGITEPKLLISFGGSLGARFVTDAVLDLMEQYTAKHPEIRHIHATGRANYEDALAQYRARGLDHFHNLELRPYIDRMPYYMTAADLVICRAGAMTTSELALTGRASIMIPSPYVAENHQYENAKALADRGATRLVEEVALTSGKLIPEAISLLESGEERKKLESQVKAFATPEANRLIYEELCRLIRERKGIIQK